MKKTLFRITGMHCDACLKVSKMKIGKIAGVMDVSVDSLGEAMILADRGFSSADILTALAGTEYGVEAVRVEEAA